MKKWVPGKIKLSAGTIKWVRDNKMVSRDKKVGTRDNIVVSRDKKVVSRDNKVFICKERYFSNSKQTSKKRLDFRWA